MVAGVVKQQRAVAVVPIKQPEACPADSGNHGDSHVRKAAAQELQSIQLPPNRGNTVMTDSCTAAFLCENFEEFQGCF